MYRRTAAALAVIIALAAPAAAHEFKAGTIEIGHPWSRPTPPSAPVASGYVKLTNTGTEVDRLTAISSPIAERAEVHRSVVADGVASMRPVDGLAIEPGATVDFEAENLHVMFIAPDRQLKLQTRLNGEVVQDSHTGHMIFPVARLVSYASTIFTLVPGDVIVTGTPAGVGWSRKPPRFMKPGDVVEVEIEGIGVLRNPIVAQS